MKLRKVNVSTYLHRTYWLKSVCAKIHIVHCICDSSGHAGCGILGASDLEVTFPSAGSPVHFVNSSAYAKYTVCSYRVTKMQCFSDLGKLAVLCIGRRFCCAWSVDSGIHIRKKVNGFDTVIQRGQLTGMFRGVLAYTNTKMIDCGGRMSIFKSWLGLSETFATVWLHQKLKSRSRSQLE